MTDGSKDAMIGIALTNDLRKIARVAAGIDEFCATHGVAPEIAYSVNLAIDELLTNTISHGYDDDEPHRIEIILRLEGNMLVVAIVDDSAPFDPTEMREPDIDGLMGGEETGGPEMDGLGLLLVKPDHGRRRIPPAGRLQRRHPDQECGRTRKPVTFQA